MTWTSVTEASAEYRDEEDTLGDFIRDEIEEDREGRIDTGDIFVRYQQWGDRNGVRYPLPRRVLTKRLRERGPRYTKTNGKGVFDGVALK